MTILEWRDVKYSDQKAIQLFECTEDVRMEITAVGRRPVHPALYEWQVQEIIRGERVPKSKSWNVRVGLDAEGLGAVLFAQEIVRGEEYDLSHGAVARRLRGRHKGAIGLEMIQDSFDRIVARCIEIEAVGEVLVTGLIHRDNVKSKRMCAAAGMSCQGVNADDNRFEDWERYLPIPDTAMLDLS